MYLVGEFRQILSVIPKGTRHEVVHATFNSSHLWNYIEVLTLTKNMRLLNGASDTDIDQRSLFSEWVLGIGDGRIGEDNELDKTVIITPDFLIPSSGDHVASIVENTYPKLLENIDDITYFQNRAILTTKNSIVEKINEHMLDMIPGEEKIYLSYS